MVDDNVFLHNYVIMREIHYVNHSVGWSLGIKKKG